MDRTTAAVGALAGLGCVGGCYAAAAAAAAEEPAVRPIASAKESMLPLGDGISLWFRTVSRCAACTRPAINLPPALATSSAS